MKILKLVLVKNADFSFNHMSAEHSLYKAQGEWEKPQFIMGLAAVGKVCLGRLRVRRCPRVLHFCSAKKQNNLIF